MTEPMQGKAVPWPEKGLIKPGEYAKEPASGVWYCRTPNGYYGNLADHRVTEHEDGTITVLPSIKVSTLETPSSPERQLWHGHLTAGVWKPC